MNNDVLKFIRLFSDAENAFKYGCCYWFAYMLCGRFDGVMYYDPVENHFASKIGDNYYDAGGIADGFFFEWNDYKKRDKFEYGRILRDCINI